MSRTQAERLQLEADYLEDIKGETPCGDFIIKKEPPFSLWVIRHRNPKGKVPKFLLGQWTDRATAQHAIESFLENSAVNDE